MVLYNIIVILASEKAKSFHIVKYNIRIFHAANYVCAGRIHTTRPYRNESYRVT